MIIVLSEPNAISDLLVYSLGLRDVEELTDIMTKAMAREEIDIKNEPLTFDYEDLLNVKLKLLMPSDLYKYNGKYDIYENMSENDEFVKELFNKAEELKIVGIVSGKEGTSSMALNPGVSYRSDLIEHIINYAKESDIVKKQLENRDINVLTGKSFDSKKDEMGLNFSDLISVDKNKLQNAFKINTNNEEIKAFTKEYAGQMIEKLKNDILQNKDLFTGMFKDIISDFYNELKNIESIENIQSFISDYLKKPSTIIKINEINNSLNGFIDKEIDGIIEDLMTKLSKNFLASMNVDTKMIASAFKLKMTEEDLTRLITSMMDKGTSTYKTNLINLGYQDIEEPTYISFYFKSFDGKENFLNFIDEYNKKMEENGEEEKVINYTDATGILISSVKTIVNAVTYILIAFVSISLVVSSFMIGIITYISVYERTKEIGILRAIGASKHNISSIFNAETFIIGFLSGMFGIGVTYALIPPINLVLHHFAGNIPLNATFYITNAVILVILSIVLTLIGGLIPARAASKKDPVIALRTE